MKRLGKMIGSQETYTKMSRILKDTLNNMNNHYEDTDRLLEDAGFHQDQDFLKAEYEKHEQVMKHYDNIIKELKDFINTVDTDIDEFDKTMNTIEQEYQNKINSTSKDELINRIKELENKLYGMCEMKQKLDLLIMRDCGLDSNTFKKLREIEEEYSKKLEMCLA